MKKFMCAEVEALSPGSAYFKLVHESPLDTKDCDAKDVKSYIEFHLKTSPVCKGKIILNNIMLVDNVPDGLVVVGTPNGVPLIACWETEQ